MLSKVNDLEKTIRNFFNYLVTGPVVDFINEGDGCSAVSEKEPKSALDIRFDYLQKIIEFICAWQLYVKSDGANPCDAKTALCQLNSFLAQDTTVLNLRNKYSAECNTALTGGLVIASNRVLWRMDTILVTFTNSIVSNLILFCERAEERDVSSFLFYFCIVLIPPYKWKNILNLPELV